MTKHLNKVEPLAFEDEVLRRMLHTPPTPHKPKGAPARKPTVSPATKRGGK